MYIINLYDKNNIYFNSIQIHFSDSKVAPSQGKETKTTLSKSRPKPRPVARTTTTSAPQEKSAVSTTTPEPPTTPDTGTGKLKVILNYKFS